MSDGLPGPGELAPVVEAALGVLPAGCWWVPGHRELPLASLRGVPSDRLVDRAAGARPYRVAPASEAPALRALYAVGLAMASRRPVLVHLGPAALGDGALYEALCRAATSGAPVVFVITTRDLAGAPVPVQGPEAAALAVAAGVAWRSVAADAPEALHQALREAIQGDAPIVVEVRLPGGVRSH